MGTSPHEPLVFRDVPLFPLPNVVLFPRAVLPLHVFEPRYRRLMQDAVAGQGLIAMALLQGDWQQGSGAPRLHEVVCVGEIVAHEELVDGRFNLLLQGRVRARIVEENRTLSYRRAELRPLMCQGAFDIDLVEQRQALMQTVQHSSLGGTTLGREIARLLDGPVSTADVADICAFNLLDDVELKQRLLEEIDVERRVKRIVDLVRASHPRIPSRSPAWPRPADLN